MAKGSFKIANFEESDLDILREIAKKHKLHLDELGRLFTKKEQKKREGRNRIFCELDNSAYRDLMNRAIALDCTLSTFVMLCCTKAIKDKLFREISAGDFEEVRISSDKLENFVNISFSENLSVVLIKFEEITEVFNLKDSPLVRYFATNITIKKEEVEELKNFALTKCES